MSAIEAGSATPAIQDQQPEEQAVTPRTSELQHDLHELDSIKQEDSHVEHDHTLTSDVDNSSVPLLSPQLPDAEATADTGTDSTIHIAPSIGKKRKRAASPPWQFAVAEQSTIKTLDGRRSSARVNVSTSNTPGPSESESQGLNRGSRATSSRLTSPPWKQFKAEGPSSISVDGVRKSGRVNKELSSTPAKRVSPRSKKQTSDAASGRSLNGTSKYGARRKDDAPPRREGQLRRRSSTGWAKVEELKAQIADLTPRKTKHRRNDSDEIQVRPRRRKHSDVDRESDSASRPSSPDIHRRSQRNNTQPTPRIKLRFSSSRHIVAPPHPKAEIPLQHPPNLSVWQQLNVHDLKEMQQPYSENINGPPSREEFQRRDQKAAEQEAVWRRRLVQAGKPGGTLSEEKCSIYLPEPQVELAQQYGHLDHLTAHAITFRNLQINEDKKHRQTAKRIANEALEYWKKKRGPTEDELRIEANKIYRLIYKQVAADVKAKWDLVYQHVNALRKARYEEEQEAKRREKLQKQLAWSEDMVARQRGELQGLDSDEAMSDDDDDSGDEIGSDEDSDENMSDEDDDSAHSTEEGELDLEGDDLQAYLAQRVNDGPSTKSDLQALSGDAAEDEDADDAADEDGPTPKNVAKISADGAEEVIESRHHDKGQAATVEGSTAEQNQPAATDGADVQQLPPTIRQSIPSPEEENGHVFSSDESVDMDSEDYDSDEDMSDSDESAGSDAQSASSEEQAPRRGLLGFFSKSDLRAQGLPTPVTSAEGDHVQDRDIDAVPDATPDRKEDIVLQDTVATEAAQPVLTQPEQHVETAPDSHLSSALQALSRPDTPSSQARSVAEKSLVPTPSLLRGTLRTYQHAGLDWLASLYRNGTNGILADEMGLGKTIQTISLFAHIAEQHNVWDAHLVIVPTSVLLNWVTEFQKFLPGFRVLGYYGTTEERHAKRRHWVNDPHHENKEKRGYNVIITSYNVALKDINAIRSVQWHYMVLDEAHNIRNFNSQRFQNLIKLKTRARLLLTGTPLQNSLTELWSLLTFLTAGRDDSEDAAHGSLEEFLARWKEPVNEIFDRGVQALSDEASKVVGQLHTSLRPFMLRRLKIDVEKDLPKKTEHVVVCKLSKRQRQLYQDYMGLSDTRAKLTQGNAISAGKVLLSLRRVCNHPDLFDPRPIQTSYALEQTPLDDYSIKERAVRRLLGTQQETPHSLNLVRLEADSKYRVIRGGQISGIKGLRRQLDALKPMTSPNEISTMAGCQAWARWQQYSCRKGQLQEVIRHTEAYFAARPIYGTSLRELLTVRSTKFTSGLNVIGSMQVITPDPIITPTNMQKHEFVVDKLLARTSILQRSFMTVQRRAQEMHDSVVRFTMCTPEVTAPTLDLSISRRMQSIIRASDAYPTDLDPLHEARIRTSIVFPDAQLLVYDSGKLQRLTHLLRDLQSRGSRSLIFTQMSGTLDILEQFLNLMNLPYLRLDGSTPVERRQLYTAEFNRPDSKYQCMILSSRAGGVGLNLTGASSVVFYDLDWNPQMDKQCMDRAHRIGQVRDVEVYKMVSEKTVEENILRRANQKSLLDQTVIQEGRFTTDYGRDQHDDDAAGGDEDVAAAIDRFLAGGDKAVTKTIESVEDKEDVQAAQQARKEEMQDEEDFAERSSKGPSVPPTPGILDAEGQSAVSMEGHVDSFMIRSMEEALRYVPYVPPKETIRDPSHRKKRRR